MMRRLSRGLSRGLPLTQRLSAMVALLLLACGTASVALQMRAGELQAQEAIQRLSMNLVRQIAANNTALLSPDSLNQDAVRGLFEKLMEVNPSVEVYLLDVDGRIAAHAAPPGRLRRDRVDLAPRRGLLGGAPRPVLGDDPRGDGAHKIFSAAPLKVDGRERGWVYVVLMGEEHEALARHLVGDGVLETTLSSMAMIAFLGRLAGLVTLHWITRPLRELTAEVRRAEASGDGEPAALATLAAAASAAATAEPTRDEIGQLPQAFAQMTQRIAAQWRELSTQDQQRREMVANISYDLRTPLTSLHGYLETLRLKADTLPEIERRRYLDIAISQGRKVGALTQILFELARLEHGDI